jgi:hypothetical protein
MPSVADARPELERIEFLLNRDGYEATRAWVERTLNIYREAVGKPGQHSADTVYRPLFEKSIAEFEEWLASHP